MLAVVTRTYILGFCAVTEISLCVPFMFTLFSRPTHGPDNVIHQGGRQSLSRCPRRDPNFSSSRGTSKGKSIGLFKKFVFDPNYQMIQKLCRIWAPLRHPNILPLFGLVDDPAIPSTGIVTPRCTFNDLHCFFSDPTRASEADRLAIVSVFSMP